MRCSTDLLNFLGLREQRTGLKMGPKIPKKKKKKKPNRKDHSKANHEWYEILVSYINLGGHMFAPSKKKGRQVHAKKMSIIYYFQWRFAFLSRIFI